MKKHKYLFTATVLAMASFCRPSPAQTTECGTDSGCFAYYTEITKTSSENTCTNNSDTYVVRSDVRTGEFPPFSITVEGAAFSIEGQQYLPGQWVDFVGSTISKTCSNDNNLDYSYQSIQKTVSVERTEIPWTVNVKCLYKNPATIVKTCAYVESSVNTCIRLETYDLCVYRNMGGNLTVNISGTFASGGYLYEWQKYDWDTQSWATVESGSGTAATQTLGLPNGHGYKTDMYRFRMRPGIQPSVHTSTAYVRNVPMDCPVP